jgi:hypothetical protein
MPQGVLKDIEQQWNDDYWEETAPEPFPPPQISHSHPGLNPRCCSEKPASDRLSYGAA